MVGLLLKSVVVQYKEQPSQSMSSEFLSDTMLDHCRASFAWRKCDPITRVSFAVSYNDIHPFKRSQECLASSDHAQN